MKLSDQFGLLVVCPPCFGIVLKCEILTVNLRYSDDHYLVSSCSSQPATFFCTRTLKKQPTTEPQPTSRRTMSARNRRTKQPSAQRAAQNELQAEIEKAEREANEKYKQAEEQAAKAQSKTREKYLQTLRQWGPTLYLFPMIPALFGVVTICVVSIVSNTDNRQRDGNLCNGGYLNTYLLLSQVLAYFFLFGYGCMFIGTKINCLVNQGILPSQKGSTFEYFIKQTVNKTEVV